jgi:protein-L-isoaspartate(D-aspartate) O-methyltransferase
MVDRLRSQGIADGRVLEAMIAVPREEFVPEALRGRAYEDERLPIGEGQTMSQPWTVARMCELLAVGPGAKVLEIGSGSGYHAAVLAAMGVIVFSVERHAALARTAAARLHRLGFLSATVKHFDGSYGWAAQSPYDGILVTAAAPEIPSALVAQLAPGGRLVLPLARDAEGREQRLVVVTVDAGRLVEQDHGEASFVPLIGRFGYPRPSGL